jgi:hypothetical protein
MALFRNSPPASGQVGVNHALGSTGLEPIVRRTRVRLRVMPPISLNLQKIAHFWIGNISALNKNVDRYKLVCNGLRPTQMLDHPALLCAEVWPHRRKKQIGNPLQG